MNSLKIAHKITAFFSYMQVFTYFATSILQKTNKNTKFIIF